MRTMIFFIAIFFFITIPILGLKGDLGKVSYLFSGHKVAQTLTVKVGV